MRVVLWAGCLATVVGVLWRTPISPVAVDRGDVLYGNGHVRDAVVHWNQVGHWHPLRGVRVRALQRAATVAAVDLGDHGLAREALRTLIEDDGVAGVVRADAWERLGHLEWTGFDDGEAAASAFELAWRAAPEDHRAGERLVQAARARTDASPVNEALKAWERVASRVPADRALARLAQGALLLASGDEAAALQAYDDALTSSEDPALQQAARLGAATCKERLGDLEAALADLDAAELPTGVALERGRRMAERTGDL
ncbi:MAG: tetratricopeptide repeat protein [Alphaproteobacteria bacterium]|nr:tetratricopeptide repeat protein [Alphaproteobacteria bacterium]